MSKLFTLCLFTSVLVVGMEESNAQIFNILAQNQPRSPSDQPGELLPPTPASPYVVQKPYSVQKPYGDRLPELLRDLSTSPQVATALLRLLRSDENRIVRARPNPLRMRCPSLRDGTRMLQGHATLSLENRATWPWNRHLPMAQRLPSGSCFQEAFA